MKRQSLVVLVAVVAVALLAAFAAGLAVANHDSPERVGPAMMVGSSDDAPDWWDGDRGPATDRWRGPMGYDECPGWSMMGHQPWMMRGWDD